MFSRAIQNSVSRFINAASKILSTYDGDQINQRSATGTSGLLVRTNAANLPLNPTLFGAVAVVAPMLNTVHMPLRWILGWRAPGLFPTRLEKGPHGADKSPWHPKEPRRSRAGPLE
jgi:hypothetical protein